MKILTKLIIMGCIAASFSACAPKTENVINLVSTPKADAAKIETERKSVSVLLDSFNDAAAKADFDRYFSYFADNGVFIGTDANENWNKKAFMEWAKPHFDKKKTWDFRSIDRHIFFDESGNLAWFDELLMTQMSICRGSGVLRKVGSDWKIEQYVLSMTIPNEQSDAVTKMKAPIEQQLFKKLAPK